LPVPLVASALLGARSTNNLKEIFREIQVRRHVAHPNFWFKHPPAIGYRAGANKPANRGSMMMKFVLFLALGAAATGSENGIDGGRYDYRASPDQGLPFARPPRTVR
jgi:hypothetical protein